MDTKQATRTLPPIPALAIQQATTTISLTLLDLGEAKRLVFETTVASLLDSLIDALPDLERADLERFCRAAELAFAELKRR